MNEDNVVRTLITIGLIPSKRNWVGSVEESSLVRAVLVAIRLLMFHVSYMQPIGWYVITPATWVVTVFLLRMTKETCISRLWL